MDHLVQDLLRTRAIEDKMLIYLRQGRISKWFSSYGQEAVSVAAVHALRADEYICTMHRNLGVFVAREVNFVQLFAQFQGKLAGFTKGRDRSFHFGSMEHHIVGMISHLGAQLGVACGLALREKLNRSGKCVLAFTGDGATSQGDFHEALNVAATWDLPVVFVVERNYWGLSTPEEEQFKFESFLQKGPAYGMETRSVDGNDLIAVARTMAEAAEFARNGKPILVEANTYRIRGHEEASGTKYYPEGAIEHAMKAEPVARLYDSPETYGTSLEEMDAAMVQYKRDVDEAFEAALKLPEPLYNEIEQQRDVYSRLQPSHPMPLEKELGDGQTMRLIDAVHLGLDQALERWPELIYMGQDIAKYGGVFKATEGLMDKYGGHRVRNTPLCESAIVGTAMGYAISGGKAMMEMQFADFVSTGFNQIVNNLAKLHYRWGQHVDVVIRMPTGAGVAAGPFHSQSTEAWFTHTPGLKVVYPAFPNEAKALLLASFEDPNPVLFFEHKALYRTVKEPVQQLPTVLPIGVAHVLKPGSRATIITYGMGVHWALELLEESEFQDVELINLRTLAPLDMATLISSVCRTHRALVLQEDIATGGIGEHIVATLADSCFEFLDAPLKLVSSDPTPVPFHAKLEEGFLAKRKLRGALESLLKY